MYKNKKNKKGFSLIETFVAITILLIAVLGPMTLFSSVISDGIFAKNQVTAFYLAQEGLELAIAERNSEGPWWNDTDCAQGCSISYTEQPGAILNPDGDGVLYYNEFGEYGHDSSDGEPSIFNRKIFSSSFDLNFVYEGVDYFINNATIEVESIVSWTYRGKDHETKISTFLYDFDSD